MCNFLCFVSCCFDETFILLHFSSILEAIKIYLHFDLLCYSKMISRKIGQSTLVALLDDGCMTSTLEESLLQLQGGLTQGSLKQGNVVPKGSALLTSNVGESKR